MLNKQKGNMYPWVTHTWNPIKGRCPHDCSYCYMKVFPQPELHLDEKALKDNLGSGNIIFVGSSTDMWADDVPKQWIYEVLAKCRDYDNRYLFQTKNAYRFRPAILGVWEVPDKTVLGITLETNRNYGVTKAMPPQDRAEFFSKIDWLSRMISIEPIMDFDLDIMLRLIRFVTPEFVSIGADSKGHHLPEPPPAKIQALVKELQGITQVRIKDNLKRLLDVK